MTPRTPPADLAELRRELRRLRSNAELYAMTGGKAADMARDCAARRIADLEERLAAAEAGS